jgi:hypothetical protein
VKRQNVCTARTSQGYGPLGHHGLSRHTLITATPGRQQHRHERSSHDAASHLGAARNRL